MILGLLHGGEPNSPLCVNIFNNVNHRGKRRFINAVIIYIEWTLARRQHATVRAHCTDVIVDIFHPLFICSISKNTATTNFNS